MNEFAVIDHFFKRLTQPREDVDVAIGDDAAIVALAPGQQLAVSTDTLVAGVHFLSDWPADAIAHKAVAVNLSDMAAMGATPAWLSVALTLPRIDTVWLQAFANGFAKLALNHNVQLIGGDLTRGPLSITVTIHGLLAKEKALLRSRAKPGDAIFVTGPLGGAGLAVKQIDTPLSMPTQDVDQLMKVLMLPTPRVAHGCALINYANAAIDISDGFVADLSHILTASGVGAKIHSHKIPRYSLLDDYLSEAEAIQMALNGGDDYELCFTVSRDKVTEMLDHLKTLNLECHHVGDIRQQMGLVCLDVDGREIALDRQGFQHF